MSAVAGLFALLISSAPAQAAPDAPRDNMVSFSTSATIEVTRDLLTVVLAVVKDGPDAKVVQATLKQTLESALVEARKSAQTELLEVRTGEFSMNPRYGRDGKINGWQGRAELVLEGTDGARVAQTAGRLSGMNVNSVGYSLSRKLREQNESRVTADAVDRFKVRSAELAKAFGFAGYTIGEVSVNSGEPAYLMKPSMARMTAMAEGAADEAVPVEPGKGNITVTVSGSILLRR
jgi:predicted secreted protein